MYKYVKNECSKQQEEHSAHISHDVCSTTYNAVHHT